MRRSEAAGLTLVELLIVTAIGSVVLFTVFANFSSGIRLFRAFRVDTSDEDLSIFYRLASSDFLQAFSYETIPFEGDAAKVTFATRIEAPEALGGDRGFGRVGYYADRDAVYRAVQNVSQIHKELPDQRPRRLEGVSGLGIRYFHFNETDETYEWVESWSDPKGRLPLAVRFRFTRHTPSGSDEIIRTYEIPAGL